MPIAISCRPQSLLLGSLLIGGGLQAETYDHWCTLHFDEAQIAAGLASPTRDLDGDRDANLIEYLGNTDPWDPASHLDLNRGAAPGTVTFPISLDRVDVVYEVVVSPDLHRWSEDAEHLAAGAQVLWNLNGFPFVKVGVKRRAGFVIDSDQDGLDDFFEEALVASDPGDAFRHLGQILPTDDFDHDGTINLDEEANAPQPAAGGSYAKPSPVNLAALNSALTSISLAAPKTLVVHTPLR